MSRIASSLMTAWDSVMWLHHKLFGQISLLFIVNNARVNILHLYFYIVNFKMWTLDSFTLNKKLFLKFHHGEGNGNPLQYSCPENPMDGGAWWATVHGVAKSRTRLSDFTSFRL